MLNPNLLSAGQLFHGHLGRKIRIAETVGILVSVTHEAQMVSCSTFKDPDAETIGRTYVRLTLQGWGSRRFDHLTPVELMT